MRSFVLVFAGLVALAAACGGKTTAVGPGDGGPPGSSGSGGSSGVSGGSGSTSGGTVGDCGPNDALACGGGATGLECPAGDNPANSDPTVACSTPVVTANGTDLYCCLKLYPVGGSTCAPDDQLTTQCPDPASYGFQCVSGDDPTSYDAYLNCSAPVPDPDGVHDDSCCTYATSGSSSGGTVPAGCTADATLPCTTGAVGFACAIGDNPEVEEPGLSCSTPYLAAGQDDYCCFSGGPWSTTTCEPDDTLTSVCPDPTSYGYVCAAGDDPTTYDVNLNCSAPAPDADGVQDDFCCTYQ